MNNCTFIGRLTANPEVRVTPGGNAVARFTIAVDRAYRKDGEQATDFFRVEAWKTKAEFAEKHFRKGMRVAVQGEMQTEPYTDRNGVKRTAYTLNANSLEFADGRNQSADADGFVTPSDIDDSPFQ